MKFARTPSLLTQRLQDIITRDSIIAVHIVFAIAAVCDSIRIPGGGPIDRWIIFGLSVLLLIIGIFRLHMMHKRAGNPIFPIVAYMVIGTPAIAYEAEIRSFWVFYWMIPLFLASFYYGRKVAYAVYAWLGGVLILQLILNQSQVYSIEEYFYVLAEFLIVGVFGMLLRDLLDVSNEDRNLLSSTLEKSVIEEERLGALINSLTDGVIAVDANLKIISSNAAALNLLDTHGQIFDKQLMEVLNIRTLDDQPFKIEELFIHKAVEHEVSISYQDGQKGIIQINSVPIIHKSTQQDQGYVILLRDVTKQKSLEEERNAFVSLMSHELRTPLTIAEGDASNAEFIAKSGDTSKTADAIKGVQEQISQLIKLTNDFSLVVDSTASSDNVAKSIVNIEQLCNELKGEYESRATAKGLTFSLLISPETPNELYTSQKYVEHILRSLLDNALKFTEKGTINLHLSSIITDFIFKVEDTGTGIAKPDQAKMFKPFYQSDDYETRSQGGLGIGLYISRRLAGILGGSLTFTSEVGRGTEFTLTIPSKLAPEELQS